MKVEGWLFAAGFFFFALAAVVYWVLVRGAGRHRRAGVHGRAGLPDRLLPALHRPAHRPRGPRTRVDAEIADGAGELGLLQPAQLVAAARWRSSRRWRSSGIVFGWWLFIIGAIGGGLAVIGLVFEYYRGEPAH